MSDLYSFACSRCGERAFLILNLCEKCEPELHATHQAAIESVIDSYTVTPEMITAHEVMAARRMALYPTLGDQQNAIDLFTTSSTSNNNLPELTLADFEAAVELIKQMKDNPPKEIGYVLSEHCPKIDKDEKPIYFYLSEQNMIIAHPDNEWMIELHARQQGFRAIKRDIGPYIGAFPYIFSDLSKRIIYDPHAS